MTFDHAQAFAVLVLAAWLQVAAMAAPLMQTPSPTARANEVNGIAEFDKAVAQYMAIQQKLRDEVGDLLPGSSAEQISDTSDTLAAAMQRARTDARQGDFFNADVSSVIARRIGDVVRTHNLAAALVNIDDEKPTVKAPRVHLRYPAASEMATMPPSLLAVLPTLPPELEYRIVGEYLVLRDVKAALILDFLPRAVPRK
jgi:hypothetical protein